MDHQEDEQDRQKSLPQQQETGRPQQQHHAPQQQQWPQSQQPQQQQSQPPGYPSAAQPIQYAAVAAGQRRPYEAGNQGIIQQQAPNPSQQQPPPLEYHTGAIAAAEMAHPYQAGAGPMNYPTGPYGGAAGGAGYPPQAHVYPPQRQQQVAGYHQQMAMQQQHIGAQQQPPSQQPLQQMPPQQAHPHHHPMAGVVPQQPLVQHPRPHLPPQPYIQPRPGRLPKDRPLIKLSVSLIDTYKHINKVYYEERDARRAARAAQKQKGQGAHNDGYDDENYDYIVTSGEMFYGRYVIKERIGKGSFGQVVRAVDSETNKDVAIKIIKSKKPFLMQAKTEIELLSHLQDKDPDDQNNVVRLLTHFIYRNHQCLVFEMLSLNLYELLKNTQFGGVSLNLIRKFAKQILKALSFLARSDVDVIHCDLKPENILLRHPKRSGVKVIDFGSSCRSNKRMYSYIQSRFYRSPEVMLGLPYTVAIDMWSLGCILVEMHTGEPLFSGSDQFDQMQKIVKMLGMVPMHMLEQASDTHRLQFFEKAKTDAGVEEWTIRQVPAASSSSPRTSSSPKKIVPGKDPIKSITDVVGADTTRKKKHPPSETGNSPRNYELFVDLVFKMLTYDPRHRIKPEEALEHPFIAPPEERDVVTSQPSSGVKQAPSPAPAGRKQTEAERPEEG